MADGMQATQTDDTGENPFAKFALTRTMPTVGDENPFAKFATPQPNAAPAPEMGVGERLARSFYGGTSRLAGAALTAAGGLTNLVGANDTTDTLMRMSDEARDKAAEIEGPAPTTVGGKIAAAAGGLPTGILTLGAEPTINSGVETLRRGGTMDEAATQVGLNSAANAAGLALGGVGAGGGLARRMVGQGAAMGGLGEASRIAGNATRSDDQQQPFDPVEFGINVGTGVGFAGLHRNLPTAEAPPPVPEARQLGYEPDFVTDANGRTVANKGDRNLGQPTGPAFEEQSPTPYPTAKPGSLADAANAISQNEHLQLGHEPDFITDERGRIVPNKVTDKTTKEPFGGSGLTEQAGEPNGQPAGTASSDGAEPPAPATAEPQAPAGTDDGSGAAAAINPDNAHRDAFAARIDQLAQEQQLTPAHIDAIQKSLFQDLPRDRVSGFHGANQLDPAMQRAQEFARATGKPAVYVEADATNQNGLNAHVGTHVADTHLREVSNAMSEYLKDAAGKDVTVTPFRKGGDEYGYIVTGATPKQVHDAATAARSDIGDYVGRHGLSQIPRKGGSEPVGFGVHFGLSEITPDVNPSEIFSAADRQVEARKKGLADYEFRKQTEAAGTEPSGEQPRGAEPSAATAAGERPVGAESGNQPAAAEPADAGRSTADGTGRPDTAGADRSGDAVAEQSPAAESGRGTYVGEPAAVNDGRRTATGNLSSRSDPVRGARADDARRLQSEDGTLSTSRGTDREGNGERVSEPAQRAETPVADSGGRVSEPSAGAHPADEQQQAVRERAAAEGKDKAAGVTPDEAAHNFVSTKPSEAQLSRGERPSGISRDALSKTVGDITKNWKGDAPKIEIHQSHDEAPPSMRNSKGFDRSVEGAYDPNTGTVHLFGDSIGTPRRAAEVLAHESVGHYGVERVVGDQWGKLVNDIKSMRDKPSAKMKDVFDEVGRRYKGADADTFASETMAVMSERGISNSLMDRALTAVRKFIRSLGINAKFSDAELRQMLVAAKRRVEGSGAAKAGKPSEPAAPEGNKPSQGVLSFSKPDEEKPTVAYAGDRFVQRERLAERKFDKPYAKLSADEKSDVDALFQTTSASRNPLFSKADREDKPQVESDAFKRWSNNATFVDRASAESRTFKTGEKVVVEAYHGTQRPDRIADVFKRNRATSGPMAFFTSDPELASSYSQGKSDTSLANEDSAYESWFKYQPKGERTPMNIDRAWYRLSPEERATIAERAGRVTQDDDGKIVLGPEGQTSGLGGFDQHMRETQRGYDKTGNPIKALVEEWLNSGALFNDEERFEDVLKLAGFPTRDVKFDSPHASYPFVYKAFIEMQRPLVATDIPDNVMKALDDAAKRSRAKPAQYGADAWDKRTRDFKDWVQMLKGDEATHAWTSIPDKATEVFKSLGYDGIIDKSGKTYQGVGTHPVYVPFEESQVKSAISNKGTFDAAKKNIRFSKADTDTEGKPAESFLDKATGLLRPNKAELASRAIKNVALQGRELARGVSRAAWAMRDRAVGQADAAVDAFRTHFDARPADVRNDALKSYEPIIAYQQGKTIADPVAKKFADTFADLFARQAAEIRKFGEDKLGLLDQYFPQLWEDPGRAEKMYADMAAKRPLAGNKSFTKERVFADYEQGIKAGMKPAFANPADALMARYQSGERYLSALRIKDGVDKLGLLQDIGQGDRVPVGFARVNDNTFAGKVVPEMVARDLNNYLAPGLSQFKAWRTFRWAQNALLSMRLGFSAFHAGFTTVDSAMTHLDLGMRKALSGDIAAALKHLAEIPMAPVRAAGILGRGIVGTAADVIGRHDIANKMQDKLVRQFYGQEASDPHTAAILDALTQGGARARMDPTDYNNDFAKALRTLRTDGIKGLAKTPLQSFGAVLEGVMRPIAHYLVPAQKAMARVELMKYELDRVAKDLGQSKGDYAAITKAMNIDALRQIAHSVVQRVDDRLGQLAYDNLMLNRMVKEVAQGAFTSVGWNIGSARVIFGGLGDVKKVFKPESLLAPLDKEGKIDNATMSRVTGRLSYLVALNVGVGMLGAITQYLLTGKGPEEFKDYFFPKTGNKNPDGTDARIALPSYVRDEFGIARHPIQTVENKLSPVLSMTAELLNNKDYFGNQVYNPDDPWSKVGEQVGKYIAEGFVPYAVQNQNNVAAAGGGIGARIAPFVGITPAPGVEVHSDFQNYTSNAYYTAHPSDGKTPEKAEQSRAFSTAVNAIRSGQSPDLSNFTPKDRAAIQKYAHEDPSKIIEKHFEKLNLQQQLAAYDKASDAERRQYKLRATILRGASKQLQQEADTDLKRRLQAKVNALH